MKIVLSLIVFLCPVTYCLHIVGDDCMLNNTKESTDEEQVRKNQEKEGFLLGQRNIRGSSTMELPNIPQTNVFTLMSPELPSSRPRRMLRPKPKKKKQKKSDTPDTIPDASTEKETTLREANNNKKGKKTKGGNKEKTSPKKQGKEKNDRSNAFSLCEDDDDEQCYYEAFLEELDITPRQLKSFNELKSITDGTKQIESILKSDGSAIRKLRPFVSAVKERVEELGGIVPSDAEILRFFIEPFQPEYWALKYGELWTGPLDYYNEISKRSLFETSLVDNRELSPSLCSGAIVGLIAQLVFAILGFSLWKNAKFAKKLSGKVENVAVKAGDDIYRAIFKSPKSIGINPNAKNLWNSNLPLDESSGLEAAEAVGAVIGKLLDGFSVEAILDYIYEEFSILDFIKLAGIVAFSVAVDFLAVLCTGPVGVAALIAKWGLVAIGTIEAAANVYIWCSDPISPVDIQWCSDGINRGHCEEEDACVTKSFLPAENLVGNEKCDPSSDELCCLTKNADHPACVAETLKEGYCYNCGVGYEEIDSVMGPCDTCCVQVHCTDGINSGRCIPDNQVCVGVPLSNQDLLSNCPTGSKCCVDKVPLQCISTLGSLRGHCATDCPTDGGQFLSLPTEVGSCDRCCVKSPDCIVEGQNGVCVEQSTSCSVNLAPSFCSELGSYKCCKSDAISCTYKGHFGECSDRSVCQTKGGALMPPTDECPDQENMSCCLKDLPINSCVSDDKYIGTCTTEDVCLSNLKTPLDDYSFGYGCSTSSKCCVDPPACSSSSEKSTVSGKCTHTDLCFAPGYEPISGKCPGDKDIQCCIDLDNWNPCGSEYGMVGSCMDKDRCPNDGSFMNLDGFCPGGFEIKCCAEKLPDLATCPSELGEHCLSGHCARRFASDGIPICCPNGITGGVTGVDLCIGSKPGEACTGDTDCDSGMCSGGLCFASKIVDGDPCPSQKHCANVACAHETYEWNHISDYICCHGGEYIAVPDNLVPEGDAPWNVCGQQPDGAACFDNDLCASGMCSGGSCISEKIPDGDECPSGFPEHCESNVCGFENAISDAQLICCASDQWYIGSDGLVYCSNVQNDCTADEMSIQWDIITDGKDYTWFLRHSDETFVTYDLWTDENFQYYYIDYYTTASTGSICVPKGGCYYFFFYDYSGLGFDFDGSPDAKFEFQVDGNIFSSYNKNSDRAWPDDTRFFTGFTSGFGDGCMESPCALKYGGHCVSSQSECGTTTHSQLVDELLCPDSPYGESICCMDPVTCYTDGGESGICMDHGMCDMTSYFGEELLDQYCPGFFCCYRPQCNFGSHTGECVPEGSDCSSIGDGIERYGFQDLTHDNLGCSLWTSGTNFLGESYNRNWNFCCMEPISCSVDGSEGTCMSSSDCTGGEFQFSSSEDCPPSLGCCYTLGFDIYLFNYAGFGRSYGAGLCGIGKRGGDEPYVEGLVGRLQRIFHGTFCSFQPTPATLRADGLAVGTHLVSQLGVESLIIHGESIGGVAASGTARELTSTAMKEKVALLICDRTFCNLEAVAQRLVGGWSGYAIRMLAPLWSTDVAGDFVAASCPKVVANDCADAIISDSSSLKSGVAFWKEICKGASTTKGIGWKMESPLQYRMANWENVCVNDSRYAPPVFARTTSPVWPADKHISLEEAFHFAACIKRIGIVASSLKKRIAQESGGMGSEMGSIEEIANQSPIFQVWKYFGCCEGLCGSALGMAVRGGLDDTVYWLCSTVVFGGQTVLEGLECRKNLSAEEAGQSFNQIGEIQPSDFDCRPPGYEKHESDTVIHPKPIPEVLREVKKVMEENPTDEVLAQVGHELAFTIGTFDYVAARLSSPGTVELNWKNRHLHQDQPMMVGSFLNLHCGHNNPFSDAEKFRLKSLLHQVTTTGSSPNVERSLSA